MYRVLVEGAAAAAFQEEGEVVPQRILEVVGEAAHHSLEGEVVVALRSLVVAEAVEEEHRCRRLSSWSGGGLLVGCRDSRGSRAGCLCQAPTLACRPRSSQSDMLALQLLC